MKNSFLLLAVLLLARVTGFGQRVIEVSYAQDTKGNYIFSCTNRGYCNYVVKVSFPTLENAHSDQPLPFEAEVKPGFNKLFTLSPDKGTEGIQLKMQSSYRKGCLSPILNPGFTYLLPIKPGETAQAFLVGVTGPDSAYTARLKLQPGDTIYAARRGMVTAVDVSNTENDAGATTTGNWNFIEIVHGDCSFGQYGVFKKDAAFVKPGQVVEAGTPLGIVGGDRYGRGTDARLSVGTYQDQKLIPLPLQFWTKENGKVHLRHGASYTSEFPKGILIQELPKTPAKKTGPAAKGKTPHS